MIVKKMSVSEWIKVTDNPIQRDTERHAAKAKHLLTPLNIHAIVFAAQLPDGSLVKLDGHTRALLWKRNQVKHPPEVIVNVIPVKSMDEAVSTYQTLDSQQALETVTDKVSGAFGQQNFAPESGLLKRGNIANALRVAWNILHGLAFSGGTSTAAVTAGYGFTIYGAVQEFSNEVFALDTFESKHFTPTSGIIAAFILTYRKHGSKIIPFWRSVFADAGVKSGGEMDGVQALNELILQRRGKAHGGSAVADMTCRAVMAAEKWLNDETLHAIPRPYDLSGYITVRNRPEIQLIKGGKNGGVAAAK
jgi:hypothetical protein